MGALEISNLTKAFASADSAGQIVAVDGLNITVEDGEFLVLLGPSGCGKSTTLRCIAGLESPTKGRISLGSENIVGQSPQNRDMAMVFQDFALYPHMSASENMTFGLKMTTDLSETERETKVEEAAGIMDIGDILDKKPGQISGGQKQRVALGRAIVRDPEVFLMDEPLSNLDAKLRTQMRTEIQRLHRQLGVTTIYVTHDQTEAMTMGDRIAILNNGELQQIGPPDYVYDHPTNRFVAGFIGSPSMNFMDVTLRTESDQSVLVTEDEGRLFNYPLTDSVVERCRLSVGDTLTIGVRPEDIRLDKNTEERSSNQIQQAMLDVVEPMGSDNFLYLQTGGSSWTARVGSAIKPPTNETISYVFDKSALHIFSADGTTLKSSGTDSEAFHGDTLSKTSIQTEQTLDTGA